MNQRPEEHPTTDWLMFGLTLAVVLMACVPIFGLGHRAEAAITSAYDALTQRFGWLYLWYGFGALVFLLWLAASRYGQVRLGGADTQPEFRTPSWLAMMFCAGIGAAIWPRSGGGLSWDCARARCRGWSPPTPWNWALTSAICRQRSSPAFPAPLPVHGSRPAAPAAGRRRP